MINRVEFKRGTKEAATQAACAGNARRYTENMGVHVSIAGEMMTRIICFDHIKIATPLLPNQ